MAVHMDMDIGMWYVNTGEGWLTGGGQPRTLHVPRMGRVWGWPPPVAHPPSQTALADPLPYLYAFWTIACFKPTTPNPPWREKAHRQINRERDGCDIKTYRPVFSAGSQQDTGAGVDESKRD